MATVFLVELDTAIRIRDWADQSVYCDTIVYDCDSVALDCNAFQGVNVRTLNDEMVQLESVTENGTAYVKVADAGTVDITQGSWFFNVTTKVLRIQTLTSNLVTTQAIIAVVLETLVRGPSLVKTRNGTDLFWDGRVLALPSIALSIAPDELGAGSAAALGTLSIHNLDGRYDRLLGERVFIGQQVRIYRGDEGDTYSAFTLWCKSLVEDAVAGLERLSLMLVSIARRLDGPMLTTVFDTITYPAMNASLAGLGIPKVWGTVYSAQAFRIASGRWKVAGHAVASIDAAVTSAGAVATITGTNVALGEFTVSAAFDSEDRLFADCRGYAKDKPGELIRDVAENFGIATTDIDTDALVVLDSVRVVNLGFQILSGSARDALNLIAQSAFVDWLVTRTNVLTARARKRDQGNLVGNPGFETDTSGWTAENNALLTRVTSPKFIGTASGQIQKLAPDPLARAAVANLSLKSGVRYTVTLMAALVSGTTAAFRVSLTDSDGNETLSDSTTPSSTLWTRVTMTTRQNFVIVFCDSVTVFCDSTVYGCDTAGGDLRVYPQYNGGGAMTVAIDEIEIVETVLLDDTNAEYEQAMIRGPVIWRVLAGYHLDGRTGATRLAEIKDQTITNLYPTAESRVVSSVLQSSGDGATVAQAILDYFGTGRMRFSARLLDMDTLIDVGTTLDVQMSRIPNLPGGGQLFRVLGLSEEHPENDVPRIELEAEGLFQPMFKPETITAA